MSYWLYSTNCLQYEPYKKEKLDSIKITRERITPKLSGWKNAIQWNIATLGKVRAYVVYDQGTLIHFSYVVWGKEKFKFLKKDDIEIGPCWTHPTYRGRGIYPMVLTHIIQKELSGQGTAYMIIFDTNASSQRGVTKAGFRKTGDIVEKDMLKRYQIRTVQPI